MVPIDILMLALLVIGVIRGIFTGGIKQILSIVGVIAGLLLAVSLSEPFSNQLVRQNWVSETLAPAVAFVVIFFLVQVAVLAATYVLRSALEKIKLGGLDKALGGIVGGGKAILVISLVLFLIRFVGIPSEEHRENSVFYEVVYPIMPATWNFIVGKAPEVSDMN